MPEGALDGQLALFSNGKSRADQIFGRFVDFHKANPDFWRLFCKFADGMRQIKSHYSARAIFDRVRWEMDTITENTDEDSLKLNNDYSPYYARMYMVIRPDGADGEGFFRTRKRTTQERNAYKTDLTFYHTGSAIDEERLMERLRTLAVEE